ncbi:MAG: hypothetical protein CMJ18_22755 [Phycisphaeraceae bacterium]|nr:hypothetical protein [Phycisphaeraceae bacterium]
MSRSKPPSNTPADGSGHYLKRELYQLVRRDPAIFEFLQNGSLDGIWYWDLENPEHEWMSHGFWELFGYDPADKPHLARSWQDMINPHDLETALENFNRHCADPKHPYDQLVRYRHKDGSTVWVRCRGLAIRDEHGKPVRMLGAHTDETALKQTEIELRRKTEELERSNADLEQFAYVASHDLQEPLRMVASYLQLIERRYRHRLDDDANEYIDFAVEGAVRMQSLLNDLLIYSRVGTRSTSPTPADSDRALDTALANLEAALTETRGIVQREPLPVVLADATQLVQLFQNLVGNALKFRSEDPARVHVSARRCADGFRFTVRDNGIGIDPRFHDQIFTVFQRLHNHETYDGTGIGLAICKKIVTQHGGRIWVESKEGRGAAFRFTLLSGDGAEADQ